MNKEEILNKYIDLIDKGYCSDCNELNCIDNFPHAKITHAIRELQQENQSLKKENKILRENAENNDKVVDKVNWENQLLKKQLEEYKDKINWFENFEVNKTIDKLRIKHNNQQKEFINYLEDEINEHKNKEPFIVVNICSSYDLNEIKLKLLEEILSKYKENNRR